MSLVVETGEVVAGANSYVDVIYADNYCTLRQRSAWTSATEAAKIAALLSAAQYLDARYEFLGSLIDEQQPMSWPRYIVTDEEGRFIPSDSIPATIKDAQCELAVEALSGGLMPPQARGGRVASENVGGVSISYFADAPAGKTYPLIDAMLRRMLESQGGLTATAIRG